MYYVVFQNNFDHLDGTVFVIIGHCNAASSAIAFNVGLEKGTICRQRL